MTLRHAAFRLTGWLGKAGVGGDVLEPGLGDEFVVAANEVCDGGELVAEKVFAGGDRCAPRRAIGDLWVYVNLGQANLGRPDSINYAVAGAHNAEVLAFGLRMDDNPHLMNRTAELLVVVT